MPYRRRYYRRFRRRQRRKPNVNQLRYPNISGMTLGQTARYAAKGIGMLKGIINSELKRYDLFVGSNTIDDTGIVIPLATIAAGDDAMQRDGNSILAKYLTFNFYVIGNSGAASTLTRVLIFADSQSVGGTPGTNVLLQQSSAPGNLVSPINVDATQRFTVLKDFTVTLSNTGTNVAKRKIYKKLDFHIRYIGTSDTNYNKNAIFVYIVNNLSSGLPVYEFTSRIAFYDN